MIELKPYDNKKGPHKPLMIGCSGGGGHISAIEGIEQYLQEAFKDKLDEPLFITKYQPVLLAEKQENAFTRKQIQIGASLMNTFKPVQKLFSWSSIPLLPDNQSSRLEMENLDQKEKVKKENGGRSYIDMLLDVYPAGYESAAIWNVLQRNDETRTLKKLIALQHKSDQDNYKVVYNYFTVLLNKAKDDGQSYTEVISTQAMALPALCDAVKDYNARYPEDAPIYIHQYMTDLATQGAIHFFNSLVTLEEVQQQQMKLYGVNLSEQLLASFFSEENYFSALYDIPVDNNPMIRPGFKEKDIDNSGKFYEDTSITLGGMPQPIEVLAGEKIASITLGSQASIDTVKYIESLLKNRVKKVFVLGGTDAHISKKIKEIIDSSPSKNYENKIIPLGRQDDKQMFSLISRSNYVIIRGGGLTVMEQMAIPHNKGQTVFVHHSDSSSKNLTSGISWEDDNVKELIEYLSKQEVYAVKTSPQLAMRQLADARLLDHMKKNRDFKQKSFIKQLQAFSTSTLETCLKWMDSEPEKINTYFKSYMSDDIESKSERKLLSIIELLNTKCENYIEHLVSKFQEQHLGVELKKEEIQMDMEHSTLFGPLVKDATTVQKILSDYRVVSGLQKMIKADRYGDLSEKFNACKKFCNQFDLKNKSLDKSDKNRAHFLRDIVSLTHSSFTLQQKKRFFFSLEAELIRGYPESPYEGSNVMNHPT